MKHLLLIYLLFLSSNFLFGQTLNDTISLYFDEVKTATKKNFKVWDKDLYGSILFVNPQTREVFANESDTAGVLKFNGKIYTGQLSNNINVANTSLSLNGKNWAMIMLPLPDKKQDRINLISHELFHKSQPSLGFNLLNVDNNHLDKKDGRIYLRLELEALKMAVQATSKKAFKRHLIHAFIFRKYRYFLYSDAKNTENQLELNEGMAEFTGLMHSGRNQKEMKIHLQNSVNEFMKNPTFVRSFAYQTTPIYGFFLSKMNKKWNKDISIKTNLTDYFINSFGLKMPLDLDSALKSIGENYNKTNIIFEETAREEKAKKLIAEFKSKFVEKPLCIIPFEQMNVSFDPKNIMPLEDKGTVYPNMRIVDNWGVLTVQNGALMAPNWDKITVSLPFKIEGKKVFGDGWIIELVGDYAFIEDGKTGNFVLRKSSK
jgi:hypothetical protein